MNIPSNRPLRNPTSNEFDFVQKQMIKFRDSGCRITSQSSIFSDILFDNVNGHFLLGPLEDSDHLGFVFDSSYRSTLSLPYPQIGISAYPDFPQIRVHLGELDYFIYPSRNDLNSPKNISQVSSGFYRIPRPFMYQTGALIKER